MFGTNEFFSHFLQKLAPEHKKGQIRFNGSIKHVWVGSQVETDNFYEALAKEDVHFNEVINYGETMFLFLDFDSDKNNEVISFDNLMFWEHVEEVLEELHKIINKIIRNITGGKEYHFSYLCRSIAHWHVILPITITFGTQLLNQYIEEMYDFFQVEYQQLAEDNLLKHHNILLDIQPTKSGRLRYPGQSKINRQKDPKTVYWHICDLIAEDQYREVECSRRLSSRLWDDENDPFGRFAPSGIREVERYIAKKMVVDKTDKNANTDEAYTMSVETITSDHYVARHFKQPITPFQKESMDTAIVDHNFTEKFTKQFYIPIMQSTWMSDLQKTHEIIFAINTFLAYDLVKGKFVFRRMGEDGDIIYTYVEKMIYLTSNWNWCVHMVNKKGKIVLQNHNIYDTWLKASFRRNVRSIYDPDPDHILKSSEMNEWKGFKIRNTDKFNDKYQVATRNIQDDFKFLMSHWFHVICDGKMEDFWYQMHWLRSILVTPHIGAQTYLVINGKQGVGKSLIFEQLLLKLFGPHSRSIEALDNMMTSGFNGILADPPLVYLLLDDCSGDLMTKHYQKFKRLITSDSIDIRQLYTDLYQIKNTLHVVICTNTEKPN